MALLAMFSNILIPFCIAAVIFWFVKKLLDRRNQPPGPLGLPIIGYLPFLTSKDLNHNLFIRLSKKYGPIFQFQVGENTMVVLNSAQAMRDCFKMTEFSYRPESILARAVLDAGEKNITFAQGERWRFCRKLANRALPVFTSAKHSRLEPNLYDTAEWLCDRLLKDCTNGTASVQSKQSLMAFTGSMMSSIIFGNPAEPEGEFVQWLGDFGNEFFIASDKAWLADVFPSLGFLFKRHTDRMCELQTKFVKQVKGMMREHEYTGEVATVSDSIIKTCDEIPAEEKAQMRLSDEEIKDSVLELFDAGFFTTAENLEWLFVLLACHPAVQAKVQHEIDTQMTEIGKPTIKDDWHKMTYCRATVLEVLRWTSNVSIGIAHTCLEDTKFGGFVIPKGSFIQPNQYAINHDPDLFPDPDSFKPERFIRADGTLNQEESEKIVSFSNGKRRCPGELLAKQNIFLFLAYVMGRIDVRMDMNSFQKNPLLGEGNGLTFFAGNHKLIFTARNSH